MCGIAGIIGAYAPNYKNELEQMLSSLQHRGPDGSGTYFYETCAFGHVRLSIIDLETGGQPMVSADKNLAVTFNGEIYGYKELRDELSGAYQFRTASDTEVILAAYDRWGEAMTDKLPGMFAFALWDEGRKKLFAARDRFGEKPFYYAWGKNGEFIFASEIKAILATGLVDPVLSRESVLHYLRHLYVAPDQTIYKNIFCLPPAHLLTLEAGELSLQRYWHMPEIAESISLGEATDKFKALLESAVKKQLVADVPVGAFLSGGLDSSTIVAVASQFSQKKLQTFAFGFGDSINELPFARAVAARYQTEHIELQAGDYDLADLLKTMQTVYDEPFGDSSNIPTYLISKAAREKTKVVLTGDGGDELFGGYTSWYKPLYYMTSAGGVSLGQIAQTILAGRKKEAYYQFRGWQNRRHFANPLAAHVAKNTYFSDHELSRLFKLNLEAEALSQAATLNEIMNYDASVYMPGDILVKTDRAAMASGLELRAPFLDLDFASFALALPYQLKIDSQRDKIILREAYEQAWPEEVRGRSKQGFGSPVKAWLKESAVADLKHEYLDNEKSRIFEILDFAATQKYVIRNNYQTWILLNLAMWLEAHPSSNF